MPDLELTQQSLHRIVTAKVMEVDAEPDHHWTGDFKTWRADGRGRPVVRIGLANCSLETDLWQDLRGPAMVGRYPLTLADVWMHYAASDIHCQKPDGTPDPDALPLTFDQARERYKRAVIVCCMAALNPEVHQRYAEKIKKGDPDPYDYYLRSVVDLKSVIHRAVSKSALLLMQPGRAVVPMTDRNLANIIPRTRAAYMSDKHHGPCNDHWPQNSIAVMTGLLKFGVNHLPFRDEVDEDGRVQRLFGRYASLVIFDDREPVTDGRDGFVHLTQARRERLLRENDYTQAGEAAASRYCTYNTLGKDGQSVCGRCLEVCPSGAQPNSAPDPLGNYPAQVLEQTHRFFDGRLDFDFRNCTYDRYQKQELFEDYVCARCETVCSALGIKKSKGEIERINGQ